MKNKYNLDNEVLNLLYELEILHDYNETKTGLKIGLVIDKLQKTLNYNTMDYRNKLDDIYSSLLNNFQDNDNRQNVLDLIDQLQNEIENIQ